MASTPGFEPGPQWWEASALTTAPPLLPAPLLLTSIWHHLYFCIVQKKKEFCKVHNNQPLYLHTLSVGEINSFLSHVFHFHHLLFNKPLSNFQDSVIILRELFILWCVDILQSNSVKYTV